ncbi:MAG: hypothetical protein MUE92_03295 [Chloroflexi bacterium]|nr:hypothetical protein [Chloroflexota bacterium]
MHARTTARAAMMLLLAALLPAACTGGTAPTAGSSAPPASVAPTEAPTASPTPPAAAATPTASPAWVAAAMDVVYESADPRLPDAMLDVYTPTGTGPWPVAVMLHGGPGVLDKGFMGIWAQKAAAEGFVVFVPTWGVGGAGTVGLSQPEQIDASQRQAACAVAYANARAADYGGDPSTMVMVGHSAGANVSSVIAFNRPAPTEGCPGGEDPVPVTSILTYEGDWLLLDAMWGENEADALAVATPWAGLDAHPDVPVVMLITFGSGGVVAPPVVDPPIDWRTAHDPVAVRSQMLTAGPDGGRIDVAQEQAMFHAALAAKGNRTSLTEVPGSGHMSIGPDGWPVFLAALREAAGD